MIAAGEVGATGLTKDLNWDREIVNEIGRRAKDVIG